MRGFTSIFKLKKALGPFNSAIATFFLGAVLSMGISVAQADPSAKSAAEGKTNRSEEDDFSGTPFTEYGEFNEASEEEEDTKFLQFGKLFGVSIGLGFESIDGNRGSLWQGGFPVVDVKLHYWFNFNLAIDLGFYTASHNFVSAVQSQGRSDVNLIHAGVDIKYYFDTKNLSSALTFANPFILLGAGSFSKTVNSMATGTTDADSSVGVSAGVGLEFTMSPRKLYFEIEGKIHLVNFKDTFLATYQSMGLADMTGNFYTITGNVLFTW